MSDTWAVLDQGDPQVDAEWAAFWEEVTYGDKGPLRAQEWMARAAFWRAYNLGYARGLKERKPKCKPTRNR